MSWTGLTSPAATRAAGALVVALGLAGCDRTPDAGLLDAVNARVPERVEVREIRSGATFGQVLWAAGLEPGDHNNLLLAFGEQANPRRLRSGTEVEMRWRGDPERLARVDVVLDRDRTVLLERAGSGWRSSTVTIATTTDTLLAAGEIRSSLWTAVVGLAELESAPSADRDRVVARLDRVFQWQIDFSRQLRAGDSFRFAFERERRPDGSMRNGRLLAAELVNRGRSLHAVWFRPEDDDFGDWYDLEGQSVRRAFLKKPLRLAYISSRFTNRRFHPILRTWRAHRGVDYAADSGSPVEATGKGVIARREVNASYGRFIDVRHANGYLTRYAHLRAWASGTAVGSSVAQGQVIGYVGMTGMATGPHLHYEMHQRGRPIDPLAVDLPAGDSVPAADRERWRRERDARLNLLLRLIGPETFRVRQAAAGQTGGGR